MKKVQIGLVALMICLVVGSLSATSPRDVRQSSARSPEPHADSSAFNPDQQSNKVIDDPCVDYNEDNEFRTKLDGQKLNLDHKPRFESDFTQAKLTPLSAGQMLVGIGDALYLLDSKKQVQWKHTVPQWLNNYAVVESTGLIYGTAGDNNIFILEAATGKLIYRNSRNGRAAYDQVVPYGDGQCLITDNFSGYREDWNVLRTIPGMIDVETWKDGVSCWQGTKMLWHRDFPPDAELLVKGREIYAVTKTKRNIYIREVPVPIKSEK